MELIGLAFAFVALVWVVLDYRFKSGERAKHDDKQIQSVEGRLHLVEQAVEPFEKTFTTVWQRIGKAEGAIETLRTAERGDLAGVKELTKRFEHEAKDVQHKIDQLVKDMNSMRSATVLKQATVGKK
jgi:archaellum component FlaC